MRFRIAGIWIMWVLVMAVLVGVTWVLMMFPLPGGSSGTPTLEEIVGFLAHVGVIGTIKILAVLFLPPIVLTYLEIRRAPGRPTSAGDWPGLVRRAPCHQRERFLDGTSGDLIGGGCAAQTTRASLCRLCLAGTHAREDVACALGRA
jgi:hypothetical protein